MYTWGSQGVGKAWVILGTRIVTHWSMFLVGCCQNDFIRLIRAVGVEGFKAVGEATRVVKGLDDELA